MGKKTRCRLNKSFYKTFGMLFGLFLLLFIVFTFFTYRNSHSALQNEYQAYCSYQMDTVCTAIEETFQNVRFNMGILYSNSYVRNFFLATSYDALYYENIRIIMNELKILQNATPCIDSIYIYSAVSKQIISSTASDVPTTVSTADAFSDTEWMEHLKTTSYNEYHLYLRKAPNEDGACMVTLLKTLDTPQGLSALVINVLLRKVTPLPSYKNFSSPMIYLLSDEGEILYSQYHKDYLKTPGEIEKLAGFDATLSEWQIFKNDAKPYIYAQQHSDLYPWHYVLITDISDYTLRLTSAKNFFLSLLSISICFALIAVFIIVFRSNRTIYSIIHLLNNPEEFISYDLKALPDEENRQLIQKILTYIQTNVALSTELEKQFIQTNNAKMLALQTQINPHFMMNTLNVLYALVADSLGSKHEAAKMTIMLSQLLRYALNSSNNATLDMEIEHAVLFSKLINARYRNTIHFDFDIQTDIENVIVPKLVIQPLIENAVFHGISKKQLKKIKIAVRTRPTENICILTVTDNGVGIAPDRLAELTASLSDYAHIPSTSIGLHNVMLRMYLLYGEDFSFTIESTPRRNNSAAEENSFTSVVLRFPVN